MVLAGQEAGEHVYRALFLETAEVIPLSALCSEAAALGSSLGQALHGILSPA